MKTDILQSKLLGPGVDGIGLLPETERRMWRTVIERIATSSDGDWIVIPGWSSSVAILVDGPDLLKWDVEYAFVSCNKGCVAVEDLVIGPESLSF